ncbi:hypothetical protein D7D25_09195 [Proteiniphilum sp. X52]|nr:hypothetical protein D7D25_09195 [Proteiniphilum sp. X52]
MQTKTHANINIEMEFNKLIVSYFARLSLFFISNDFYRSKGKGSNQKMYHEFRHVIYQVMDY